MESEIKDFLDLVAYELKNTFDIDEPDEFIHKSRLDEAIEKDPVAIMEHSHYEWAGWIVRKFNLGTYPE